jgi:glycosyltransferase involved in cell wall biosynthesis
MRNTALFFVLLGVVCAGSYVAARKIDIKNVEIKKPMALASRFAPVPFTLKNLSFTVVIVGQNNGANVAKTLSSVFSQCYENYRVIYIDDASDDGSYDLARDLIYDSSHLGQVTLVRNEERLGHLANIYRAVQICKDEEIVVILQGEDWLAHEWVLQRLNAYYADPDLWLTYGQYRDFPTYELGICQECKEMNFRLQPFQTSHLKTFYAALFKKIREPDFIYGGQFLPAASDLAYMTPMLEMARDHSHFIPEILYICNRESHPKENREEHLRCERFVRSLIPYQELIALEVSACGE